MPDLLIFAIVGITALALIAVIVFSLLKKKNAGLEEDQDLSKANLLVVETAKKHNDDKTKASVSFVKPSLASSSGAQRTKKICLACTKEFEPDFKGKCPECGIELSSLNDYLAPGSRFSEYYEIVSPLGSGGLSNVFLAKHISSGRKVAIKLLHTHLASDNNSVQRFQREANTLSKLSHENLVAVEDFMVSTDGVPFIVMAYLEGESLAAKLRRERRLSWKETAEIFVQVCKGLSHAHSKGIIHRDLKPANIMLVPGKSGIIPTLVDFGLVKANNVDSIGRLTATGEVFGSPLYMSPEQCQGREVDRRSDVYSCACIMYECLSSSPPFVGKNVIDTLSMHLDASVPELAPELETPPWMVQIIKQAMQKNPERRMQSIDDLGAMIQDGLNSSGRSKS